MQVPPSGPDSTSATRAPSFTPCFRALMPAAPPPIYRVLAPDDRVPVERDVRTRPRAEGPRLLDQPVNPPRPYQGLFGNSPTVDAGTSERPRLHERHAGAELHALLQGVDAGRAATDLSRAGAGRSCPSRARRPDPSACRRPPPP